MSEKVFLIGPNGQISTLTGPRGVTPECAYARFHILDVVRVRRLKHLRHLPELGAVVAVVPPGFSPDHAWDDLCGRPRRLMCQVGARIVKYIVAFEGDKAPHLMRERDLLPTDEPPAEVSFAAEEMRDGE
jgi:hypothetical protein